MAENKCETVSHFTKNPQNMACGEKKVYELSISL